MPLTMPASSIGIGHRRNLMIVTTSTSNVTKRDGRYASGITRGRLRVWPGLQPCPA